MVTIPLPEFLKETLFTKLPHAPTSNIHLGRDKSDLCPYAAFTGGADLDVIGGGVTFSEFWLPAGPHQCWSTVLYAPISVQIPPVLTMGSNQERGLAPLSTDVAVLCIPDDGILNHQNDGEPIAWPPEYRLWMTTRVSRLSDPFRETVQTPLSFSPWTSRMCNSWPLVTPRYRVKKTMVASCKIVDSQACIPDSAWLKGYFHDLLKFYDTPVFPFQVTNSLSWHYFTPKVHLAAIQET